MRVVCPTCQAEYELPPKTSFRCSCGTLLSVDARGEFHWRVSAPGGGIGKAVLIVFAAAALLIAAAVAAMLVLRGGATKTVKSGAPALRGDITVELRDGVRLELVKVEAGTFTMGDRRVTLNNDYYIGMTEVTQEQWYAMMGPHRARFRRGSSNRPLECVSWNEAMAFCEKLNEVGKAPKGWKFTLPTEAQWEYAARGGNRSRGYEYSGGDDADDVAWYWDNSDNETHPVAQKRANELGLYDMSGNVCEWCLDWYGENYARDPEHPERGGFGRAVVVRGGCWSDGASKCGSTVRRSKSWNERWDGRIGFRVVLVPVR